MHLKAALLATLAAGSFFLTACGGGSDSGDGGSSPASQPQQSPPTSEPQQSPPATCQSQTIVGGNLFVAEQAPVGVTLLSTGGLSQYTFTFLYDSVFGIATSNRHDKWGQFTPFAPGTPIGTSAQLQLQPRPPSDLEGPVPSTFPKGVPVELWLTINDGNRLGPANSSSTADIGKDLLGRDQWHTASVTYGANNTATVTFFASTGGPAFSVSLTNVSGSGSPGRSASSCPG